MQELLHFLAGLTMQMVFLFSLGVVAYTLCRRWLSEAHVGVRWCATCTVFCWLLSLLFAVLMTAHMFSPLPATIVAVIVLVVTRLLKVRPSFFVQYLVDDLAHVRELAPRTNVHLWRISCACFLFVALFVTIRAVTVPLFGWDSLTYHGLKSGLWVQKMGWSTLNAPGGWEYYQSFFGGGEVYTSWAMLFFHSDLMAGIPDVFFWGLFGLVTICLAREFGMRVGPAVLVGLAFLCIPFVYELVGTGYVDTCANSLLMAGLLFLVRFARSRRPIDICVAAAALGLASSVKVNMLATSAIIALPVLFLLLRSQRLPIKLYGYGAIVFIAPVVPWLAVNYATTGYPLGCTPLSIGPIQLGAAPPNLAWFLDRPDIVPYVFADEAQGLAITLGTFGCTLLLIAMGVPGFLWGIRQCRREHVLIGIFSLAVIVLYLSPSFSVVRLAWASTNGRFLIPVAIAMAAVGLPYLHQFRRGTQWIETAAAVSISVGALLVLQKLAIHRHRAEIGMLALAAILTAVICGFRYFRPLPLIVHKRAAIVLSVVAFVGGMFSLDQFRASFHTRAYSEFIAAMSYWGHWGYWVPGLRELDSEPQPVRIAIAYGAQQTSHDAFLAPFLGRRLNNELLYVSPDSSGLVVPHHPDYRARSHPSFEKWMEALRDSGATHVLCLHPPCDELRWVQDHPQTFSRLAGKTDAWGLFRIQWPEPGN